MTYAIDRKGVAHKQLPHLLETVCGRKGRNNPRWSWGVSSDPPPGKKPCSKCGGKEVSA